MRGPLFIRDAFVAGPHDSDAGLLSAILNSSVRSESSPVRNKRFDPRSELILIPENVAKVVNDRMTSVRLLPFGDRTVVAVGNKIGNLGFWDVNFSGGDGDGIYVYQPHSGAVSEIQFTLSPQESYWLSI